MKKTNILVIALAMFLLWGCTKTSSTPIFDPESATAILPLKPGNSWIYMDSTFNPDGSISESDTDTSYVNTVTTSIGGVNFFGITDSLGWFGTNSLLAIDPSNTAIYSLDSINATTDPLIVFSLSTSDGYLIGTMNNYSNPTCVGVDGLYGYATTYTIGQYTCYKNIDTLKDCEGNIISTTVMYISPGVGIVRIEEYSQVPGRSSKTMYLDYSQTLQSATLK